MSTPSAAPKKVLFLITKSNWGGAQRYVYDLATHLDRGEFEPVVALGGNGVLADQLTHAGIRVISLSSLSRDISLSKEVRFAHELWHILRTERPVIFHVNSSKAGGVGTFLGRLARVPRVIFTAHGWAFNEDRPWWQRVIIKFFHWLTVLFSHKTIAVSRAIITQMNWPGAQAKMKLIHPGRTIGAMFTKSEARAHIVSITPTLTPFLTDPWLGCIAELHPIKRHAVLIASVALLVTSHPRLRLIIIGEGEARRSLETLITQHNLEEHVFLVGAIPEAARFLAAFDLFALASKSESYGYVLHEAALAHIPIVATNVGGIPDIITHEETGLLVAPDDHTALATAINQLLTTPTTALSYARQAAETLTPRSVQAMTDATTTLYTLRL